MLFIAVALFFLGVAFFIYKHELPEHRMADRKGLMLFHGIICLACLAIGFGILWVQIGPLLMNTIEKR